MVQERITFSSGVLADYFAGSREAMQPSGNPKNHVTVKDVARKAGVSTATAARVLGGYGSVSDQTREIVLKAARELNYVPNALARSMVKARTGNLGLVVPDIRNAFFSAVAQSVVKSAKRSGHRVIICDTGADYKTECRYLQDLFEQRVDGIILASSVSSGRRHPNLKKAPCPVVLIDRNVEGAGLDCVRTDHEEGAYRAVKHLLSLGHRRIGIVVGTGSESVHFDRRRGYEAALAEEGIPIDEELIKQRDWERGLSAVDELFALADPPTAIFSTNYVITVGVLSDLKRLGKRIPEDVAVVSFDDLELAMLLEAPLTALVQDPALIGTTAMELLLQRVRGERGKDALPQEVVFRPALVVRQSCGAASGGRIAGAEPDVGRSIDRDLDLDSDREKSVV